MNPKVFISHASEDKKRFVIGFATQLRSKGIDAWLDKWEMFPGDSLVDKIFEEGIKDAKAFIIVISKNSITKPWVKEELNAAFMKRIENQCKIIPIVLDNATVPECLRSTLWEKIDDINHYESALSRVVNAIFEYTDKPPVSQIPQYMRTIVDTYTSINKTDSIIFDVACQIVIKHDSEEVSSNAVYDTVSEYDIEYEIFKESIDILDRKGYIKGIRVLTGEIPFFAITVFGMDKFIRKHYSDFDVITKEVCYRILNNSGDNIHIANELELPCMIVNHIYNLLEQRGLIKMNKFVGGSWCIYDISPELRRIVNE